MSFKGNNSYQAFGPTSCAPDEMIYLSKKIYFIVAYCSSEKKHRCFGYYCTLDDARKSLQTRWKDMEECYYDSFFIESIEEGIFRLSECIEYYEINGSNRQLVKKNIPADFKNTINWSIG